MTQHLLLINGEKDWDFVEVYESEVASVQERIEKDRHEELTIKEEWWTR